jgi:hypothetical protein
MVSDSAMLRSCFDRNGAKLPPGLCQYLLKCQRPPGRQMICGRKIKQNLHTWRAFTPYAFPANDHQISCVNGTRRETRL